MLVTARARRGGTAREHDPKADLVFVNGDVYTVDAARQLGAGGGGARRTDRGRRHRRGDPGPARRPSTEVVDLHGRMLLPGFQDAHVHPVGGGLDMIQCDLHDLATAAGLPRADRSLRAAHTRSLPWILGGGWAMDAFPGRHAHQGAAGRDRARPARVPAQPRRSRRVGELRRARRWRASRGTRRIPTTVASSATPRGNRAGTLHEGAADLVERLAPGGNGRRSLHSALLKGQAYLHSLGITAWQDAIVGTTSWSRQPADLPARPPSRRAHGAGGGGAVVGPPPRPRADRGSHRRSGATGQAGRFAATSVKIMQDGVCENFTAAVLEPYLDADGAPNATTAGISFVEPELLKQAVTRLDAEGFQVHFHALAERAVREALDAIEAAAAANGPSDHRHHLAHLQVVHPDDIPRFRALGAVANAAAAVGRPRVADGHAHDPVPGGAALAPAVPVRQPRAGGGAPRDGQRLERLDADPFEEMHVAVNRAMAPDYPHEVDNPRGLPARGAPRPARRPSPRSRWGPPT